MIKMSIYKWNLFHWMSFSNCITKFLSWYFVYRIWYKREKTIYIKLITSIIFELCCKIFSILWNISALILLYVQDEIWCIIYILIDDRYIDAYIHRYIDTLWPHHVIVHIANTLGHIACNKLITICHLGTELGFKPKVFNPQFLFSSRLQCSEKDKYMT